MRWKQLTDFDALTLGCIDHTLGDKVVQTRFIRVLKLTTATLPEMGASRCCAVRTRCELPCRVNSVSWNAAAHMATT
ncbi:MAG: hypothetical protein AAFY51_05200 [Pseudomonadota bacterium]